MKSKLSNLTGESQVFGVRALVVYGFYVGFELWIAAQACVHALSQLQCFAIENHLDREAVLTSCLIGFKTLF